MLGLTVALGCVCAEACLQPITGGFTVGDYDMPSDKHPHGTTLQQGLILAIVQKHGPVTSSAMATHYQEITGIDVAYNYQFIVTRRMASRGLIKSKLVTNSRGQRIFEWTIAPKGKKLLNSLRNLSKMLAAFK